MKKHFLSWAFIALALVACKPDDDQPEEPDPTPPASQSPVVFDPAEVPYQTLSEYNFFEGDLANLEPVYGVLPYDLITPLFSDYAKKKRFVWMPDDVKATYDADDQILDFPESSVLLKSFYYKHVQPGDNTQILETRVLFKRNGIWEFAEYIWNEEQTEAFLDLSGKNVPIEWMNEDNELQSVNFRIPAEEECFTCHKNTGDATPLGPKPQNINRMYEYAEGVKNQLAKWEEFGYLESYPSDIVTVVAWDDPTQDLELRFRSYLDMNCSSCHMEGGHCDYRPIRLAFSENDDPVNQGVCIPVQEWIGDSYTYIISAGDPNKSAMTVRMESTEEQLRMPLLGRTLEHEEGVELIREYIDSLEDPC